MKRAILTVGCLLIGAWAAHAEPANRSTTAGGVRIPTADVQACVQTNDTNSAAIVQNSDNNVAACVQAGRDNTVGIIQNSGDSGGSNNASAIQMQSPLSNPN